MDFLALFCVAAALWTAGCSSGPQLYPNQHYKDVGEDAANADIKDCEDKADAYVKSSKGKKIATGAATGAVVGAAVGSVLGAFTHSVARGAIVGAAAGGAGGAAHGALSPDQVKRNFVKKCLKDKGYEVIGWN